MHLFIAWLIYPHARLQDILQFLVFLCIAMVAFIVSLRNLYSFYTEDAQGSKRADAAFKE